MTRRRSIAGGVFVALLAAVVAGVVAASARPTTAGARWTIRDLGTLGSDAVRDYDFAADINARGAVVGASHTAARDVHAFVWRKGKMLDLVPVRAAQSYASAVNDRGEVVGTAGRGKGMQAFLWENGKRHHLDTLDGKYSYAVAISGRRQVVGRVVFSLTVTGPRGRTVTKDVWHAFSWWNRPMVDLGSLGGMESEAVDVNDHGQVVGWSTVDGQYREGTRHAFLWEHGGMIDLGTLGGRSSAAVGVNSNGHVIGWSEVPVTAGDGKPMKHAFLWEHGRMIDLGTLGGRSSAAVAINGKGQVVGRSDTPATGADDDPLEHAFLWQNGRMRDLGTLAGGSSWASDINERGQIVGGSGDLLGAHHAFVWTSGKMTDLGTLPGRNLASDATAVNDQGEVVGTSTHTHAICPEYCDAAKAVLWTPRRAR